MFGGTADGERLHRAPLRLPRPRRAALARWAVAAGLVVLAALVLLAGGPVREVAGDCPAAPQPRRPVPPPGSVGVPVHLAAAGAAGVVRPGDRVDVLAAAAGPIAEVVAENVLVLSVQRGDDAVPDGASVYVAALPATARRLVGVASDVRLAITVRPP
jgi:Flp pilus assembly protein CpaB